MAKLLFFLCLFGVSLAFENGVLFQPKTWIGPGVLPTKQKEKHVQKLRRSYVTAFNLPDGISHRKSIRTEVPVDLSQTVWARPNKRQMMRKKLEEILNMKGMALPSKMQEKYEQAMPLQFRSKSSEDSTVQLNTQQNNVSPAMEVVPNWSRLIESLSAGITRRKISSTMVNKENNEDNISDNTERSLDIESNLIVDEPLLKTIPTKTRYTRKNPNCACHRRIRQSPIEASEHMLGFVKQTIYKRSILTFIQCSCTDTEVTGKSFQSDPETENEFDIEIDDTNEQIKN